jgi:hypothetical protein
MLEKLTQSITHFDWAVAPDYRFEDSSKGRVIVPVWDAASKPGARGLYRPALEPQLVEDFAAVEGAESLKAFALRYGLLGYRQLHPPREDEEEGPWVDPVAWSLAHARTVAGALGVIRLMDAVRNREIIVDDESSRKAVAPVFANEFHRAGLKGPHNKDTPPGWVAFRYLNPEKAIVGSDDDLRRTVWIYGWENDPIRGAYSLVAWLVNPGIKEVRYELACSACDSPPSGKPLHDAELGIGLVFDALLSVIYLRLAERAMNGEFRHCKECGRVFPAKGKQLFCGPACANRRFSREFRKSHRDELNERRRRTKSPNRESPKKKWGRRK